MRTSVRAAIVIALVAALVSTADAKLMIAPSPPAKRAIMADVVVVGKVTSIEKDLVQAAPYPGAKEKVGFQIAIVKIDTGLIGADKLKEIKVGIIPPPKLDPNVKPGGPRIGGGPRRFGVDLKEGQELMLFLAKHPSADFYMIPGGTLPVDMKGDQAKKDLESVKQVAAILADPSKALKSDKPEVRAATATIVILKHRNYPVLGGEVQEVAIGADESKLLLNSLIEGNWSQMGRRFDGPPSPLEAFQMLGLNPKDGWIEPVIVNNPGAPPVDYGAIQKDAFMKWLEGPGKDYKIKKLVPKTQK
ncbi:MAG: hypothetical protein C0467_20690 [Planctomycetaceae bacterium]|nr:hypothetical protein [Planctomycetaceae bacterium]